MNDLLRRGLTGLVGALLLVGAVGPVRAQTQAELATLFPTDAEIKAAGVWPVIPALDKDNDKLPWIQPGWPYVEQYLTSGNEGDPRRSQHYTVREDTKVKNRPDDPYWLWEATFRVSIARYTTPAQAAAEFRVPAGAPRAAAGEVAYWLDLQVRSTCIRACIERPPGSQ